MADATPDGARPLTPERRRELAAMVEELSGQG